MQIDVRLLPGDQFRDQLPGHSPQGQSQHAVPRRDVYVPRDRSVINDRQTVVSHRSPAPPFFGHRVAVRFLQVRLGTSPKQLQPGRIHGAVVPSELHRGTEAVARAKRCHRDACLRKDHGNPRTDPGTRHRQRVSLSGLNGEAALQVLLQQRRPRPSRHHKHFCRDRLTPAAGRNHATPLPLEPPELHPVADLYPATLEQFS